MADIKLLAESARHVHSGLFNLDPVARAFDQRFDFHSRVGVSCVARVAGAGHSSWWRHGVVASTVPLVFGDSIRLARFVK